MPRRPKPRATYHHGDLRRALVEAALEVIDERGADALSVREVARRAGVSSGAPFRHFADKTALLAAVAEDAERSFLEHIAAAIFGAGDDPMDRFQSVGVAFVEFAVAHPARFRVMHLAEVRAVENEQLAAMRAQANAHLRLLVEAAQAAGRLPAGDPGPVMLTAYALSYGLARIYTDGLAGDLGVAPENAAEVARAVTDLLGRGIDLDR